MEKKKTETEKDEEGGRAGVEESIAILNEEKGAGVGITVKVTFRHRASCLEFGRRTFQAVKIVKAKDVSLESSFSVQGTIEGPEGVEQKIAGNELREEAR